jgi:predicted outer membrane repeat protein
VRRLLLCTLVAIALPGAAEAAEYQVDNPADGAGNCAVAGQCTLRGAILAGNSTPERDLVHVPPGTYELTGADLIVSIGDKVDVVGADPRNTILKEVSGGDGRVFLLEQDSALGLSNVTVTGSRNVSAVLLFGTGIDFRATNVTFSGNTAANGGAIDGTGGAVALENSTLTGNTATGKGGAVYLGGAASTFQAINTTISGNTASAGSGVYVDAGTATLTHVTLADQLHVDSGMTPGAASLKGTIVGTCAGAPPVSLGSNLEPGTTCGLAGAGDRPGADPALGPLQDNGGLTATRAPAPGSPALDAAAGCPPPTTDQREIARPQLSLCDIGSVEVVPPPPPPPPRVIDLRLTPSTFRAAGSGASLAARRRPPVGSRLRFRLSERSTVRFTLRRKLAGRRAGARCVKPTRANRRARRCIRLGALRGAYERTRNAGAVSLRFRGRWRGRKLGPGGYRLYAVARERARAGAASAADFRIVR